jgi:hypothetical protein
MTFAFVMTLITFLRAIFTAGDSTQAVCASTEPATRECECDQAPEGAAPHEKPLDDAPLQASEAKTPAAAIAVLVSAPRPVGC